MKLFSRNKTRHENKAQHIKIGLMNMKESIVQHVQHVQAIYCEKLKESEMRLCVVFRENEMNVRKTCKASENTLAVRLRLLYSAQRIKHGSCTMLQRWDLSINQNVRITSAWRVSMTLLHVGNTYLLTRLGIFLSWTSIWWTVLRFVSSEHTEHSPGGVECRGGIELEMENIAKDESWVPPTLFSFVYIW